MNTAKLRGRIVEMGTSVEELAGIIGIDRSTLYRKLNDAEKITIGEAVKMKEALKLSNVEAAEIFFGVEVA